MDPRNDPTDPAFHVLQPGERISLALRSHDLELRVTDRRLLVTSGGHVRLDIGYEALRRIQFDVEAAHPATLVIVPQRPTDEPQVLTIPRESLHQAAEMLAFVGERLP
jgi:hypothetical protein